MPEFLRDPVWQFIGAALGAVGIFIMVWIYLRQKSRKALSYRILFDTPLVLFGDSPKERLEIRFDGTRIHDLRWVAIQVVNSGNVPIIPSDFVEPVRFCFGETAQILIRAVTDQNPGDLEPSVDVDSGVVTLNPLLMNRGDSFVLSTLGTQFASEIDAKARIVGVSQLTLEQTQPQLLPAPVLGLLGGCVAVGTLPVFSSPDVTIGQALAIWGFGIVAGATAALWLYIFLRLYFKRRYRKRGSE